MFSDPIRTSCGEIAVALAEAGRKTQAVNLIERCTQEIPPNQVPPDQPWLDFIDAAYKAGDYKLAEDLSRTAFTHFVTTIRWYNSIIYHLDRTPGEYSIKRDCYLNIIDMADDYGRSEE